MVQGAPGAVHDSCRARRLRDSANPLPPMPASAALPRRDCSDGEALALLPPLEEIMRDDIVTVEGVPPDLRELWAQALSPSLAGVVAVPPVAAWDTGSPAELRNERAWRELLILASQEPPLSSLVNHLVNHP
jgi:hypothetical protein